MNKPLELIRLKINAMLEQARQRLTIIGILVCINLVLVCWITINMRQTTETRMETIALQETNQIVLEQFSMQQSNLRGSEEQIKKRLASREDLNGLILSLESTAPAHSVTLSDGSQNYIEASKDKLPHSLIQYNVQGSYANVLQFVAESLNKHEALVLKSLSFRRADPMVSNLQINLEWAFYYL